MTMKKKCIVCDKDLFLDWAGENYICINRCQKISVKPKGEKDDN